MRFLAVFAAVLAFGLASTAWACPGHQMRAGTKTPIITAEGGPVQTPIILPKPKG